MNSRFVFIAVFLATVSAAAIYGLGLFKPEPSEERLKWSERIDKIGAVLAYEEYKKESSSYPFNAQHPLAHLMGALLFEKEGVQGLAICDESVAFGCYHGFFAKIISERGIDEIAELDRVCNEKFGLDSACRHGIGHGVMEYFGPAKLVRALKACEQTTENDPLEGCTRGIFMEYNLPTVTDGGKSRIEIRKVNFENLYEPCNTIVPEKFRPSCYHELPQWWSIIFNRDFQKIGDLCGNLEKESYREACYLALGNMAASLSEYDFKKTFDICENLSDNTGRKKCKIGAANIFLNIDSHKSLANEFCEDADKNFKEQCNQALQK